MPPPFAPTREAALTRIDAVDPSAYARTRNHLEGAVTGLSPYLTHGFITLTEVIERLRTRHTLHGEHKLLQEFAWRCYFHHVWKHAGERIFASLHEGPLPDEAYTKVLPEDIRRGATGVPVIDRAVRVLYADGWLHNHVRMWLASYVVHFRKVQWRAGADWMYGHLLDGDLASNHLSWQWVAGTGSHKPYLFNAENVARFSPLPWHSPGSVVDRSYDDLDRIARSPIDLGGCLGSPIDEPALLQAPPDDIIVHPESVPVGAWIVHPWALGPAPADRPVVSVFLADFHRRWPWSEQRWRFVATRMAELGGEIVWRLEGEAPGLRAATRADRHLVDGLPGVEHLPDISPIEEPAVRCRSFSQYWSRLRWTR